MKNQQNFQTSIRCARQVRPDSANVDTTSLVGFLDFPVLIIIKDLEVFNDFMRVTTNDEQVHVNETCQPNECFDQIEIKV